jgi:hypothetical protein
MKKTKVDKGKGGFNEFLLRHVEKIVMACSIIGLAAFVWLGWSTTGFHDSNPKKLLDDANTARTRMLSPASWESIETLRPARVNVEAIVKNAKPITLDGTRFGALRGHPVETLGLRIDPDLSILRPEKLEYDIIRAPIVLNQATANDAAIENLADALLPPSDNQSEGSDSKFGNSLTPLQDLTLAGVNSDKWRTQNNRSLVANIVAIRGLVQHAKLWENYTEQLKKSVGYFPERDQPKYLFVQVQRRAMGDAEYQDITDQLLGLQSDGGGVGYAQWVPETLAPENYDGALSQRIPTIALQDYRPFSTHSALPVRSFGAVGSADKSGIVEGSAEKSNDETMSDLLRQPDEKETEDESTTSTTEIPRRGSDTSLYNVKPDAEEPPIGEFKVVRIFDPNIRPNTTYEYRIRIWIDDPNNEPVVETVKAGSNPGNQPPANTLGGVRGATGGGQGAGAGADEGDFPGRGGFTGPTGGESGDPRGGSRGGGDPTGGRTGGSGQKQFIEVPITDSMKDVTVRSRIDRERIAYGRDPELKALAEVVQKHLEIDLQYCRPSEWVELKVEVGNIASASAIAGDVIVDQVKSPNGKQVSVGDPASNLLVQEMSNRFGTLVSNLTLARRGDLLSPELVGESNILHFVAQTVKKLTEYSFSTNKFVLDILGGEVLPYAKSPASYQVPGEVLVFDVNGEMTIQSTWQDRRDYLNWRFQEDESSEYNVDRSSTRRTEESREGDDRNPFGGRGGGGRGGDFGGG